jgi:basic membrane protein A
MLLTACGAPAGPAAPAGGAGFLVCQVTDLGGVDDKSFNASAWKGVQDATTQLGVRAKYLVKGSVRLRQEHPAVPGEDADLVVTIGFCSVLTRHTARGDPERLRNRGLRLPGLLAGAVEGKDCGSASELPNVRGLTFQTDEAAFLAGYLAAGMTETGKVGTFGGIKLPTVTIFMKGFEAGVKYYNEQKGANVEVLGWDNAADDGLFTGNFDSTDDGRKFAESLMQEGADIIMPVAGPVASAPRPSARRLATARSSVWMRTGIRPTE